VDLTGPRRFTRGVLKSLEASLGQPIEEKSIANLLVPKLVGDILILPGYALAASSNNYQEGQRVGLSLVKHHYAGTWKNKKG
jgi:hypothetical protein